MSRPDPQTEILAALARSTVASTARELAAVTRLSETTVRNHLSTMIRYPGLSGIPWVEKLGTSFSGAQRWGITGKGREVLSGRGRA